MLILRFILAALLMVSVIGFFYFDGGDYLSFASVQSLQGVLLDQVAADPMLAALGFAAMYVMITALSLPGAAILTLLAGALFGLIEGLLLASFASTLGATLAMLAARFIFRDWVALKFQDRLRRINAGMDKDGARYLLSLRLVPAVPFFLINLAMGLTRIRVSTFFWVSQLGMLPGTLIYVNAGVQIGALESAAGILSIELISSLVLLALLPWLMKFGQARLKLWRQMKPYPRPKTFDRDLIVIGAGSGGLVTALIGAVVEAKVTLIEAGQMGGDCLNTGCVPSKSLIRSARLAHDIDAGVALGVRVSEKQVDFETVMSRVQGVIDEIRPNDSPERYREMGVDVRLGQGRVRSPYEVEVNGERLTTRAIIIASGAYPILPAIDGLDPSFCMTSETVWQLSDLPKRLAVVGGGPIGVELAQSFARLGSEVTLIEMMPRLMMREEIDVSDCIEETLAAEGVRLKTGHRVVSAASGEDVILRLVDEQNGDEVLVPCDGVLFALGRKPRTTGFGLEDLGVALTASGHIEVNDYLQTNYPSLYAVGDVAGPYQFTHTASHMAWYAAVNALFGTFKRFKVDYRVVPWCTFSSPEVARVGLNETEANAAGLAFETTRFDVAELDRAKADDARQGFVKVLTVPGSDKILGVTIVSEHAGETISEFVLAMKYNLGLKKIMGTIHIYPTWSEMNKFAAGVWRRANKPERFMPLLAWYHRIRRGGG